MQVALARKLDGIDSVELGALPDPEPALGRALVRVHGAGVGLWDVGFLGGGFPGITLPFVPGQEIAGVVEAAGGGAGVEPGERVYAVLFPAGGGFAELALASADRLAPMPAKASFQEAAGLVISAGTAYEGLVDRGRVQPGETVLITAAAGGVGSAAVQIAVAHGARVLGVASTGNHEYLRGLGASEVFDYHTPDWVQQRTLSSCRALLRSWSVASPANRSPPTLGGRGSRNSRGWSTPASCVHRWRRCYR